MQIFFQLRSGKTVCVDVTQDASIQSIIEEVNHRENADYSVCFYKKAFYEEEHPMAPSVHVGQVLDPAVKLQDLYEKRIIKEIVLVGI